MRVLLLLLAVAAVSNADDLDTALARLRTAPGAQRKAAIDAVVALDPKVETVVQKLRGDLPVASLGAGWHALQATDLKGVARPFHLYVPKGGRKEPMPLLVYMHGGVSRPEYVDRVSSYCTTWTSSADEHGFVIAYPAARGDCMWWADAGVAHVRAVIRESKRLAPIDDEAVVGTGFSDGGSGCFYFAMAAPEPFAAFLPMNGHPAVAANASKKQLYLRNLRMAKLFCAMTQDDQLYPAVTVIEHLQLAMREGAKIRMVSYELGGHRNVYFEDQRAAFVRFLMDTPRDAHQQIDWWCGSPATGRIAWLEVLEIGPAARDAKARPDLNVMSSAGRVRLGFNVDRAFAGPGVKVAAVTENSTAERIGMAKDDVVIAIDGKPTNDLQALIAALGAKKHGTPVAVDVRRGEKTVKLKGAIPAYVSSPYYLRSGPTARLSIRDEGSEIGVTSRNVRRYRIYRETAAPAKIMHNGAEVKGTLETFDLRRILEDYARDADKGRVYAGAIVVAVP